jgi:hypothetical protein
MPESEQIDGLLAKQAPDVQKHARLCLAKLRKRMPTAVEMVYDYGKKLVFSFGATENGSEAVCALVVAPEGISLALNWKGLPDPEKRLRGSGNQVRSMELGSAEAFSDPYVVKLLDAALETAKVPLDPKAKRRVVIKSKTASGPKRRSR